MKVLLDENVPHNLRRYLPAHEVITVGYVGWSGLKNGRLLKAAEGAGIDVLVTGDKNIRHQQRLSDRRIAVVFLSANNWPIIKNYLPKIAEAVDRAEPGSLRMVDCGKFGAL